MVNETMFPEPIVGGASIPHAVVTGPENPRDSNLYKNLSLNERGDEALNYRASPEINLQLYNFLQGLYRTSIEQPTVAKNEEEKRTEVKSDPESYVIHIKSLPKTAQTFAPGLINFLTTNTPLRIEPTGFVSYPNIQGRVHVVDLMKTLLSTKGTVDPDTITLIKQFISILLKAYIKNKNLFKQETEEYWDTFN